VNGLTSVTSRDPDGAEAVDTWKPDVFTICEDEPLSAAVRCELRYGPARGDGWRTRLESVSETRADAATFRVWTSLRASITRSASSPARGRSTYRETAYSAEAPAPHIPTGMTGVPSSARPVPLTGGTS